MTGAAPENPYVIATLPSGVFRVNRDFSENCRLTPQAFDP
jgi:hypothetical protein